MGVFRSVKHELGLCQIRKVGSESWRFWFSSPYARWIASLKYFWFLGVKVLNLGVFEWGVSMAVMFDCFIVQNQLHSSELLVDCDMVFFGITFLYPSHVVYLLCDFDAFFFFCYIGERTLTHPLTHPCTLPAELQFEDNERNYLAEVKCAMGYIVVKFFSILLDIQGVGFHFQKTWKLVPMLLVLVTPGCMGR